MRLIDADAIPYTMLYKENWMGCTGIEKQGVWKDTIDAMPTIELETIINEQPTVEGKTGKWVSATVEEVGIYKVRTKRCTYCGERAIDGTSVAGATMDIINNFCPNCGADMRGGNQ